MVIKKCLMQLSHHQDKFWRIEVNGNTIAITCGQAGTTGKSQLYTFESKRECLREADKLVRQKVQRGYMECESDFMEGHVLPKVLKGALHRRRTFSTEEGKHRFLAAHEVPQISVVVDILSGRGTRSQANLIKHGAVQKDTQGLFCAEAYALTDTALGGPSRAVLVWLPRIALFGTWYPRSFRLIVFPGLTWTTIEKDPAYYLEANRHESFPEVQQHCLLESCFHFIPHNFSIRVGNILALRDDIRRKRVDEFLSQYERIFREIPYSSYLSGFFESLVTLYYRLGINLESDWKYEEAIPWFKRSLHIITQSNYLRSDLFSDIYLQLGFCCLETSRFDAAIRYINLYQQYDTSAWEACDQIKASIRRSQQLYKETINSYLRAMERESYNGREEVTGFIERTVQSYPNDPVLHFNLACFFAVSERVSDALYHLEEALKKGFVNREKMVTEHDLQNIKNTQAFEDIFLKYL